MQQMSRWILFTLCLLLPNLLVAEQEKHLTLIFASNMPEIGVANKGSYAKLASLLEQSRQQDEFTLFVFGGSSLGPSPLSSLDRGSHIIDILNTLEPDLMNISKREFSYFEDELTLRSYEAAFPFISSNLYDPLTKSNLEGISTNLIIDKGDLRLGFIAILDEDAVEEYLLQRVRVQEPRNIINQQIKQLEQQGADLIVLIYSQERDYYQTLLDSKKIDFALKISPYVDDMMSDELELLPKRYTLSDVKTTLVLKLSWPQNSPKNLTIDEVNLDLNTYPSSTTTALLVDEYNKRLNRLLNQPIGVTVQPMTSQKILVRTQETAFGNFVADAMKDAAQADVAFINGGSIRGNTSYQANTTLTRGDIIRELPFRTHLVVVTVSGQQLWDTLENAVSEVENAKGRFLQIAGISINYSVNHDIGKRLQSVKVNGKTLVLNKQYVLATTDYLLKGGDGYTSLLGAPDLKNSNPNPSMLSEVVIRAIQNQKMINPQIESRIVRTEL